MGTMVVDMVMVDTAVDTHTVMANRNCFRLEYLAIFLTPPFGAFETYTTALCNITENCVFFYEKIVIKLIFGPIVIKNSQKCQFQKKGPLQHHPYCSPVMISNYLSEIVILFEN